MSRGRPRFRLDPPQAAYFSMVLGLAGLGQAWRSAHQLWANVTPLPGEIILGVSAIIWAGLLGWYLIHALRRPQTVTIEFRDPVRGATPALIGVATVLMVPALYPYSPVGAAVLACLGVGWHLGFALWHTSLGWLTGRAPAHWLPSLYLPTVAGNLTSAAALAVLGWTDWGWLLFGAGVLSWLALESLILMRLWDPAGVPVPIRALVGIQFAPPVVAGSALLTLAPGPGSAVPGLMLLGYSLFQLLLGFRLQRWFRAQPYSSAYWAYSFGASSTAVVTLKLALGGVSAAQLLAPVILGGSTLFIGTLFVRTLAGLVRELALCRQRGSA